MAGWELETVLVEMRFCPECGAEALATVPLTEFPHYKGCPRLESQSPSDESES